MLWVLVMVCIPYAGMVLYLIFGSTTAIKLTSAFRRRRLSRRLPAAKVLWVLVMVCIPYAGMVLYLIFGSTTAIKLTSAFRRRRLSRRLPAAKVLENLLTDQQDSRY